MFKTLLLFKADKPDSDLSKRAFLRSTIGPKIHKWVESKEAVVRCACTLIKKLSHYFAFLLQWELPFSKNKLHVYI